MGDISMAFSAAHGDVGEGAHANAQRFDRSSPLARRTETEQHRFLPHRQGQRAQRSAVMIERRQRHRPEIATAEDREVIAALLDDQGWPGRPATR